MTEYNVKKTGKSKFGFYILVEQGQEDKFLGVTEQVSNFIIKQVPCKIFVESIIKVDGRDIIDRIKVLNKYQPDNSANEFEQPVEVVRPGEPKLTPASSYKPTSIFEDNKQNSIVAQFSIKAAIHMIEVYNNSNTEKIAPTMNNILNNARIAKQVYDELLKPSKTELPDY